MNKVYNTRGTKTLFTLIILRVIPAFFLFIFTLILLAIQEPLSLFIAERSHLSIVGIVKYYYLLTSISLYLCVILIGVGSFTAWLQYISFKYMLDDFAFKIRTGIFSLNEMSILYRQIQNVDMERPLAYRLLGMSKLIILTAGHEDEKDPAAEAEGVIDMMDKKIAENLQRELLNKAHVQVVATTGYNPHDEVPPSDSKSIA